MKEHLIMAVDTLEVQEVVSRLIYLCLNCKYSFESAARSVSESQLRAELREYSRQREEFAEELRAALAQFGLTEVDRLILTGLRSDDWTSLARGLSKADTNAVLAGCVSADHTAIEAYRDAVCAQLPEPLNDLIENQYESVQRVYDRVLSVCETQPI